MFDREAFAQRLGHLSSAARKRSWARRSSAPARWGRNARPSSSACSLDIFHIAATYVDRILHGAQPSDLAIQFPIKFNLAINLKTAKAIGLHLPKSLIARASEVIE
jgi:hypothetical protein